VTKTVQFVDNDRWNGEIIRVKHSRMMVVVCWCR